MAYLFCMCDWYSDVCSSYLLDFGVDSASSSDFSVALASVWIPRRSCLTFCEPAAVCGSILATMRYSDTAGQLLCQVVSPPFPFGGVHHSHHGPQRVGDKIGRAHV